MDEVAGHKIIISNLNDLFKKSMAMAEMWIGDLEKQIE